MTEIQQQTMSRESAERLTERIRYTAMSVRDGVQNLQRLVTEAQDGQAHLALGYPSWTAYIAEVMGDEPLQLRGREERREVVSWLAGQGMSTRAIAPVVGVQHSAVAKDLRAAGVSAGHTSPATPDEPTFDATPSWDPVDTDTGEIAPEPRPVTGLDGKTYTRPEPKEADRPRPEAITSQFSSAIADLNRVLDRLHRISNSANYPQNKNQVATLHGSDLGRAISELQTLADALN